MAVSPMVASDQAATPLPHAASRALLRFGAWSGFLASALAAAQVGIEVIGVGIARIPVPASVEDWFGLLQTNRLLALTELTGLQVPMFVLLVPLFLALYATLRAERPTVALVATALALMGIGVYLASNTAFSMLTLSDQWAAATAAQRSSYVAAGQAMLAIYDGPGLDAGVLLVMIATLGLSATMLGSPLFGRATASTGIVAGAIGLSYYLATFLPSARIFLLEAAGPFFVLWIILASRRLLRM